MISIYYNNGRVLQGIALAFGDRAVRVAVKDSDDAWEFRLINQVWVSRDCEVVRLEFAGASDSVETGRRHPIERVIQSEFQPATIRHLM